MVPSTPVIVVTFFVLLAFVTIACAFYIKLKRRYTRERYAFTALSATVAIVALTITSIKYVPPWTGISQLIATLFGLPVAELPQPHWSENALIIIFAMFAIWLIHKAFVSWGDRPISVKDYERAKLHEEANFVLDGLSEFRRVILRGPPIEVYTPAARPRPSSLTTPTDSLAWRDIARDLLELRCSSYHFDEERDWYPKADSWIGRDTKDGKYVAVLCVREEPSSDRLNAFIQYVNQLTENEEVELIVAVEAEAYTDRMQHNGNVIRIESQSSLLNDLVDFGDYISDIRKRVNDTPLPDSEVYLPETYIESQITEDGNSGTDEALSLEKYLLAWLKEPGQRQLALLGEYGQGKSTGALMFTYHALTGSFGELKRIPLLIELRGKCPSALPPLELLGAWASHYRIDPRALMILLRAGKICLILEGFDEMSAVADPEARLAHFRTLWRFCLPKAKILITGRPNLFLDDSELKSALGIAQSSGAGPYCEAIHLKPFSLEQMHIGLRWTEEDVREEILELARTDEKFRDIAFRPSLLYIIALLWKSPQLAKNREQMSAASVMGAFVDHCFRRQTEKQRETPQFMVLTESERRYFTNGLACFMVANELQNQISHPEFEQAITSLYSVIPEKIPSVDVLTEEPVPPLRQRLAERDDALDAVITDVRAYGLLVRDHSRFDALKFPHKSFFEYLFGAYVANHFTDQNSEITASIRYATNVRPEAISDMPEALAFAGEIIARTLPSSDNRSELLQRFFARIVLGTNKRVPSFIQRIVLIEEVWGNVNAAFALFKLFTMMLLPIYILIRISRRKKLLLWLHISQNLGFSTEEMSSIYGNRAIKGLLKIAERQTRQWNTV